MKTKAVFLDIPVELDYPRVYPSKPHARLGRDLKDTSIPSAETVQCQVSLPVNCQPRKRRKGLSAVLRANTIHVIHRQRDDTFEGDNPIVVEDWPQAVNISTKED